MKTTNIIIRVTEREKELIKADAAAAQMNISEYIISLLRAERARNEVRK